MKYEHLTQDELDTQIAAGMHSREVEHSQHATNLAVYTHMLDVWDNDPNYVEIPLPPPDNTWREYVRRLASEAAREMHKIDALHAGLSAQLPASRAAAAHVRAEKLRNPSV
jgi:hypothetical protein